VKRAHVEYRRTLRVWREHLAQHDRNEIRCKCEFEVGRFRKSWRVGGCGQSRCFLCHGDKLMKRPTLRQHRSNISFHEWELDYPPNKALQTDAAKPRR